MRTKTAKRIPRRRRVAVIAVALGAVAAMPATSQGGTFTVKATGSKTWNPASLSVSKGSRVVWKNPDDADHTVTAYGRGWSKNVRLDQGESTSFRFRRSRTYKYRCTLHSKLENGRCDGMCGKVRVR